MIQPATAARPSIMTDFDALMTCYSDRLVIWRGLLCVAGAIPGFRGVGWTLIISRAPRHQQTGKPACHKPCAWSPAC